MTTNKRGECVHYYVFRKDVSWDRKTRTIKVRWTFFRELHTLKGHMGAYVRNNPNMIVRKYTHTL